MRILIFLLIVITTVLQAQEVGPILCGDGIDNDNNGLTDCEEPACFDMPNNGCERCIHGLSFADTLLDVMHGCPDVFDLTPEGAVGVADWNYAPPDIPTKAFLGRGGYIKLGFLNNVLINSGDDDIDLWIFETGNNIESIVIYLRPKDDYTYQVLIDAGFGDTDGDEYFRFEFLGGSTTGLDIDKHLPGFAFNELKFDAVKVEDGKDRDCYPGTPGADIDAVCALYNERVDCKGIIDGPHVIDDCNLCLDPLDSLFNISCIDCAGIPNGESIIDFCGACLEIDDPNYNQSCDAFEKIYIPNTFSPNGDGINDYFTISFPKELDVVIKSFQVYNRWGEIIYQGLDLDPSIEDQFWDGTKSGGTLNSGIYSYKVQLVFDNGYEKFHFGTVTLLP